MQDGSSLDPAMQGHTGVVAEQYGVFTIVAQCFESMQ